MKFNNFDNVNDIKNEINENGISFFQGRLTKNEYLLFGEKLGNIYKHKDSSDFGITVVKTVTDYENKEKDGYKGLTSSSLFPHTDRSTMQNPPNILILYCHEQSGTGGESVLIDIKKVIESIIDENKKEYIEILLQGNSTIFSDNDNTYKGNIIDNEADGSFFLRFRNDNFSFFTPKMHDFLNYFYKKIEDNKVQIKLEEGQGYIINNGRYLHGRTSFKGNREMWRLLIHDTFLNNKGFCSEKLSNLKNNYYVHS